MPTDDPITVLLVRLQAGDPTAARPLFDQYFVRLVGLARQRMQSAPRRAADEQDVALSAVDSFCRNAGAGRFPDLTDRDGLWRLLAAFTLRKAAHHARDAARVKRRGTTGGPATIEDVFGREPDPALAAEMADECARLLTALGDSELRRIALLRMEGYSVDEVAGAVGCAPRSVKRRLHLIRSIWNRETRNEAQ